MLSIRAEWKQFLLSIRIYDAHKTITIRAFQGLTVHKCPWAKVIHIWKAMCNYLKSLLLKTHTWCFAAKLNIFSHGQKMCCKQRWTGNPMGIVGNLNLSAMFTCAEMLPKRSDPLTPHVNCFHSVSERQGWGVVLSFFPQDSSSRMQLQLQPVCILVPVRL